MSKVGTITIDLSGVSFTLEEVMVILGDAIDVCAKYETNEPEDLYFMLNEDESEELIGERLAHYANQAADVSKNWLLGEQKSRLIRLASKKGVVKCQ